MIGTARRRRSTWVLAQRVVFVCLLPWAVSGCSRSGPSQAPQPDVLVTGEWKGFCADWNGGGIPESDTVSSHLLLYQRREVVTGTYRIARQSGTLASGSVTGEVVNLSFPGGDVGQIVYLEGQVTATTITGRWRKVDLQDTTEYSHGYWTVRRM